MTSPQTTPTPAKRVLNAEQLKRIDEIAAKGGSHVVFMRCVLGEQSYFELALMSQWLKQHGETGLTADEMRYIAERW